MKKCIIFGIIIFNMCALGQIKNDVIILPDGAVGDYVEVEKSKSAVLMLHGFGSARNEVGNMYRDLASILSSNNISSLRIDFRGFGDSRFPTTDASVTTMLKDASEALTFLKEQGYKNIGVQGFSLGGGIAQELTIEHKKDIKSVSLWSSVIRFSYEGKLQDEEIAIKRGSVKVDLGFRTINLGKTYFEELKKYDFFNKFIALKKTLLVQYGTNDYLYTNINSFRENAYKGMQVIEIKGADHIFNVLSNDKTLSQTAINNSANFFRETLK